MKKNFKNIYQFKITLKGIKPPIWRRIQVPETYTFWDLHVAIQDSMGWSDYHLHQFEILDPSIGKKVLIGIPDDENDWLIKTLPDWKQKISRYFSMENSKANYEYDFGDGWEHCKTGENSSKGRNDFLSRMYRRQKKMSSRRLRKHARL